MYIEVETLVLIIGTLLAFFPVMYVLGYSKGRRSVLNDMHNYGLKGVLKIYDGLRTYRGE